MFHVEDERVREACVTTPPTHNLLPKTTLKHRVSTFSGPV